MKFKFYIYRNRYMNIYCNSITKKGYEIIKFYIYRNRYVRIIEIVIVIVLWTGLLLHLTHWGLNKMVHILQTTF